MAQKALMKTLPAEKSVRWQEFYVKNNPCRLPSKENHRVVCRYCVVCGEDRFTDEVWTAGDMTERKGKYFVSCDKDKECVEGGLDFYNFFNCKHMVFGFDESKTSVGSYHLRMRSEDQYVFRWPPCAVWVKRLDNPEELKSFFVVDNPWRLAYTNPVEMYCRFCVYCAHDRFSDATWGLPTNRLTGSPVSCNKTLPCRLGDDFHKYFGFDFLQLGSAIPEGENCNTYWSRLRKQDQFIPLPEGAIQLEYKSF